MWVSVAWAPTDKLPQAFAQLLAASVALLIAFAHIVPGGLDLIARVPGTGWLVGHLSGTSGRATVDASGLAEGLGGFLATSLYVGWFPVPGFPIAVRCVGLTLAIGYVWEAVLQAVIDPGWYSIDVPPGRGMRVFRIAIPVILASIIAFVLLSWNATDARVSPVIRTLLAASPLAYYIAWAVFDVVLRASATSLGNARSLWRWDAWGEAHSSVKNTLVFLNQYVEEPNPDLGEIRSLTRNALIVVDEFRGQLLRDPAADAAEGSVGELWGSVLRTLGKPRQTRCILSPESAALRLSATDYQIAQRVLPDLLSNALKAGAATIEARCTVGGYPARVLVELADNGVGIRDADLSDPVTSLRVLRARLRARGGDLRHSINEHGGTTALAYWLTERVPQPIDPGPAEG
jgi:hypothetical protein